MRTTMKPPLIPHSHGLMLSDPMVVARHERRKTQTRRLISVANTYVDGRRVSGKRWKEMAFDLAHAWVDPGPSPAGNAGPYLKATCADTCVSRLYPIYRPGDQLWWKECHKVMHTDSLTYYPELVDGRPINMGDHLKEEYPIRLPLYRATDEDIALEYVNADDEAERRVPWTPSMLMPRRWARFVDTVVSCHPERLCQVTDADAEAEGVVWNDQARYWHVPGLEVRHPFGAAGCYLELMKHLHGADIVERDPWVWVIGYRFGDV